MSPRHGVPSVRARLAAVVTATSCLAAKASSPQKFDALSIDQSGLILLQASAQVSRADTFDHSAPRMLAAEGCDGSTAMLQHAAYILSLHGINVGQFDEQKELLDKPRNPFITQDNQDIIVAMQSLQAYKMKHNQTLLFKSILHRDLEATLSPRLLAMGTMAAYSTRRNKLDQLICMVRDCFLDTDEHSTPFGYPVDSQGKASRLCFERRGSNAEGYKAYIKVSDAQKGRNYLQENLEFFDWQEREGERMLAKAGYNAAKVHFEDMVAFQESKANIPTSLKAWTAVLKSWGVTADETKLTTYLTNQAGMNYWTSPSPRSNIYNAREVEAELKRLGRQDLLA